MALSIAISTSSVRELSLTPSTLYFESRRFILYVNLWSRYRGAPAFECSKYASVTGWTLRLGPMLIEAEIRALPQVRERPTTAALEGDCGDKTSLSQ